MNLKTEEIYSQFLKQPEVTTDSRKITNGCIFFALRGENFDGNTFASKVLAEGASMAVIDNPIFYVPGCVLVDDVLLSLQQLSNHHRKTFKIPVVGITGSNGKTTTKELISAVLGTHFNITATQGNLNNHIGVPLTLLRINEQTQIAIIEMGANHQGEIEGLCKIAEPTHGMITNIGKAHLEGFGGYEGVIKAKAELYTWLHNTSGKAFVNADNPLLVEKSKKLACIYYGTSEANFASALIIDNPEYLALEWVHNKTKHRINTHLIGSYNFENALAALCIGMQFEVPKTKIIEAIQNYIPSNSRSQLIKTDFNTIIMDAYNANPTSMQAAISNFMALHADNKLMILGDMLELGDESKTEHETIIDLLIQNSLTNTILVGPEFFKYGNKNLMCFINSEQAFDYLQQNKAKDFTILLKGSRGIKMEKILPAL